MIEVVPAKSNRSVKTGESFLVVPHSGEEQPLHAGSPEERFRATAAFLAGYAATWTWFGVIAFAGDILVHQLIHHWSWLAWHPWMIAGTTLLVAGGFQFSPLKERCLAQCRTPYPFFQCHYFEGLAGAWWLGLEHGRLCLRKTCALADVAWSDFEQQY